MGGWIVCVALAYGGIAQDLQDPKRRDAARQALDKLVERASAKAKKDDDGIGFLESRLQEEGFGSVSLPVLAGDGVPAFAPTRTLHCEVQVHHVAMDDPEGNVYDDGVGYQLNCRVELFTDDPLPDELRYSCIKDTERASHPFRGSHVEVDRRGRQNFLRLHGVESCLLDGLSVRLHTVEPSLRSHALLGDGAGSFDVGLLLNPELGGLGLPSQGDWGEGMGVQVTEGGGVEGATGVGGYGGLGTMGTRVTPPEKPPMPLAAGYERIASWDGMAEPPRQMLARGGHWVAIDESGQAYRLEPGKATLLNGVKEDGHACPSPDGGLAFASREGTVVFDAAGTRLEGDQSPAGWCTYVDADTLIIQEPDVGLGIWKVAANRRARVMPFQTYEGLWIDKRSFLHQELVEQGDDLVWRLAVRDLKTDAVQWVVPTDLEGLTLVASDAGTLVLGDNHTELWDLAKKRKIAACPVGGFSAGTIGKHLVVRTQGAEVFSIEGCSSLGFLRDTREDATVAIVAHDGVVLESTRSGKLHWYRRP